MLVEQDLACGDGYEAPVGAALVGVCAGRTPPQGSMAAAGGGGHGARQQGRARGKVAAVGMRRVGEGSAGCGVGFVRF